MFFFWFRLAIFLLRKMKIFNNISNLILWTTSKKMGIHSIEMQLMFSTHQIEIIFKMNHQYIDCTYKINTMKRGNKMKWKMFLGKRPLNHPHKMERISMCLSMDAWCVCTVINCFCVVVCILFFAYSMLK